MTAQQRELELLHEALTEQLAAQATAQTKPWPRPEPWPKPRWRSGRTTAVAQAPAAPGHPRPPAVGVTVPTPPIPTPPGDASFTQVFRSVDGERVVVQQHLVGDREAVRAQVEQLLRDLED